jgi:hypothetical protein
MASTRRPNIPFIMTNDFGWFNIGSHHHCMMEPGCRWPRELDHQPYGIIAC